MIIKNNYIRVFYNMAKAWTYPLYIIFILINLYPSEIFKVIHLSIFTWMLACWKSSKDALSE